MFLLGVDSRLSHRCCLMQELLPPSSLNFELSEKKFANLTVAILRSIKMPGLDMFAELQKFVRASI